MSSDPKPRRFKWLKRLTIAGMLLVAAVIGWWYLQSSELRNELQALRAQGMPTDGAELNEFYQIPSQTPDITPVWIRAMTATEEILARGDVDTLPILGKGETPIPSPGKTWGQLGESRSFLSQQNDLFAEILEACGSQGAVRFPVDFEAGSQVQLPWAQNSRSVGRLLMLDAWVHAHDEDSDRVLQDVKGLIAVSETLRYEPTIVSQLVRMALVGITTQTLIDLLPTCDWSDDDLMVLQEQLRAIDLREAGRIGLIGERAICLQEIGKTVPVVLYQANVRMALEVFSSTLDALDGTWQTVSARQAEVSTLIQARAAGPIQRMKYVAALMLLPPLEQFVTAVTRTAANQRAAICVIAAERHFRQHGEYPASLDTIDQRLFAMQVQQSMDTIDPFTGDPLKYVLSEDALLIYSVGPDGNDDGGSLEWNGPRQQFDVGFRLTIDPTTTTE
jgi:hypothetical protein